MKILTFLDGALRSLLSRSTNTNRKPRTGWHENMPTADVFMRIYEEGTWGKSPDPTRRYFSGSGSANSTIVEPYVRAMESFLLSLEKKPDVVDLGCGDFYVGSRIRVYVADTLPATS